MDNIKLIKGKYKGYEVCFAKKGQIFSRDGYYLVKGSDVIYLEDALDQVRLETIREVEEVLPEMMFSLNMDWEEGYNECLSEIKSSLNKLK